MEQGRSQPVLNGESRIELLAHVNTILKMAEHFKESGEREELREADTAKMLEGATIIDNRVQGNAAAMRRALVEIRDTIMNGGFDGRSPAHFVNLCDAALSAPPRQCDVGTADEQEARYYRTGEVYHSLTLRNTLSWSQTPYDEECL